MSELRARGLGDRARGRYGRRVAPATAARPPPGFQAALSRVTFSNFSRTTHVPPKPEVQVPTNTHVHKRNHTAGNPFIHHPLSPTQPPAPPGSTRQDRLRSRRAGTALTRDEMERRAAGFEACKLQAEALLEDADAQALTARRGAAEAEAERARAQRTAVALMQQRDSAAALAGRAAEWELEVH